MAAGNLLRACAPLCWVGRGQAPGRRCAALGVVIWSSSRLTAASRRVPESSAGCGEVSAPEPPPASPQRPAGGGAGWPRARRAPTAGPCLPRGPAGRLERCTAGLSDPTAGPARSALAPGSPPPPPWLPSQGCTSVRSRSLFFSASEEMA